MRDEKFELEYKELNYNSYLKIPELLSLQKELSEPKHHDEMFFIVIHQAMELWFKELLHETGLFVSALKQGVVSQALKVLKRNIAIMELCQKQINLLHTLTPVEFAGFRDKLRPASGFQSMQFREFEFTYGLRDDFFMNFFPEDSPMRKSLATICEKPSVYDVFLQTLKTVGYEVPDAALRKTYTGIYEANPEVEAVIKKIYENPEDNYHWVLLFEAMVDFDEKVALWRSTHLLMVERTIGNKRGTGGSSGQKFLEGRLHYRFFPELWNVRAQIGSDY